MTIQPWEPSPAEMDTEFRGLPYEVKLAALEYARACAEGTVVRQQEAEVEGDPEFIIVGVRQHGSHILFASTAIKATKFARHVSGVDRVEIRPGVFARIPRISVLVGAELHSFEQYVGAGYREVLRTLLGEWDRKALAREQAEQWAGRVQVRPELPPGG
jgi:hypothetical protein